MSQAKISLIIVTYNVEKYIKECLESVINQNLIGLEVIVVDDGSTDGTLQVIEEYTNRYPFIICKAMDNSGGAGKPRNVGIELSTGEYIAFLDGDDYIKPNTLERLYEVLKEVQADMLVAQITNFNSSRTWHNTRMINNIFYANRSTCIEKDKGLFMNLGPCNKVYKRKLIEMNNIRFREDVRNGEDQIFTLKAYMLSSQIYIDCNEYYYYRQREELDNQSATQLRDWTTLNELLKVQQDNFDFLYMIHKQDFIYELWQYRVEYDFIRHIDHLQEDLSYKLKENKSIRESLKIFSFLDIMKCSIGNKSKIKLVLIKYGLYKVLRSLYKLK